MSCAGRPIAAGPVKILAPWNREYGTINIGFVGRARKGCVGGSLETCVDESEAPGDVGVVLDSDGDGGAEDGLFVFITCRVLQ